MGGKILEKDMNIEEAIKKVNSVVKENFSILDSDDNDVEKWTSVPKLLLLDESDQKKVLSLIEYMDSSELPLEQKIMVIVSLSGLIDLGPIKISDYNDDANLYLLADYYQDTTLDNIIKTINIIKNENILFAVRKKTLDPEERKKILSDVEKSIINDKIDTANLNASTEFIKRKITEIQEM